MVRVGQALKAIQDAVRLDPALTEYVDRLLAAESALEDVERGLRQYLDALEAETGELEALEQRLLLLAELRRKFGPTLADVLATWRTRGGG